jgi:hypothetical protein
MTSLPLPAIRRLTLVTATVALAVSALGAPASALTLDPLIAVVQGTPGASVDVCLDGKEVRSSLPYGSRYLGRLAFKKVTLKVFKADPRKCKGTKLAQKVLDFTLGGDRTLVLAKGTPRLVDFDNAGLPLVVAALNPYIVIRHAASVGAMGIYYGVGSPLTPSAIPTMDKGQQVGGTLPPAPSQSGVWATHPLTYKVLAQVVLSLTENRRYEVILVGSKGKNLRWVVFSRPMLLL